MAKKSTKRAQKKKSKTGSNKVNWEILRLIGIGVLAVYRRLHRFPLCPHSNNALHPVGKSRLGSVNSE